MKYLAVIILVSFSLRANALKLELNAAVDAETRTYENLTYNNIQKDISYHSDNTYINFIIKGIVLEKSEDSKMDVFIGLRSIGIDNSSKTINSPWLNSNLAFYPAINSPFINQAYAKIYNFYKDGINAYFGRQSYTLGQGIVLSDGYKGFDGLRFDFTNYLGIENAEAFIFRDILDENVYRFYGINVQKNGFDGVWQLYFMGQKRNKAAEEINFLAKDSEKDFVGIRYYLSKNQLFFDAEYVIQSGKAKNAITNKNVNYNGYAFLLKGQWKQNLPLLGHAKTRLSYGKSSGDSGNSSKENKAFYADYGYRFNGANRDGFGKIFCASLYDVFKTSNTLNGLAEGISGLNIINLGFDRPYKSFLFSIDYFVFKAAENTAKPGVFKIGNETDIKVEYKLGEKFSLLGVYASFSPNSAILKTLKSTKMTSLAMKARF